MAAANKRATPMRVSVVRKVGGAIELVNETQI